MDALGVDDFKIDEEITSSMLQLDNDELEAFAGLYEDLTDDKEVELFIFTCFLLFKKTGSIDWADRSFRRAQRWTALTPLDSSQYRRRYRIRNSIRNFTSEHGHETLLGDQELEMKILNDLFRGARYGVTGSIEDLTDTINFRGNLLSQLPPNHPKRPEAMVALAKWLVVRFKKDKQLHLDDLLAAIRIIQPLTRVEAVDPLSRAELLILVSQWLNMQYECDKDLKTLGYAIDACRHALCLPFESDGLHCQICTELANMLMVRAVKTKNPTELHEANATIETLLESPTLDQSGRVTAFNSLAVCAAMSFSISGEYEDLGRAIDYIEMALECPPIDSSTKEAPMLNLVQTIHTLTKSLGACGCQTQINRAINLLEVYLKRGIRGDFSYYRTLIGPASSLADHFSVTKDNENLDQALRLMGLATEAAPLGFQRAECLCKSSEYLNLYFHHTSHHEHLDQAVLYAEQAVYMTLGHADHPKHLANLGCHVLERAQASGKSEDLHHGIKIFLEALNTMKSTDLIWPIVTQNLASANFLLFLRTKDAQYLNLAIDAAEKVLSEHPIEKDDDKYMYLCCNLALWLCNRADGSSQIDTESVFVNRWQAGLRKNGTLLWSYKGSVSDVDRALDLMNTVIQSIDIHHNEWGSFHKHLGDILMHRFMMFLTRPDLGRSADTELDLAIEAQEVALQFIPSENPNRAMLFAKTSATLSARFEITNDPADLQKLLDCLQKGVNCHHNEPRVRINMAKALGVKLIESSNYVEASQVLEQAVRLLPMACSRSSSSDDKQEFLKSCYGLASMSAGTLLSAGKSPSYALEILEAGRGVVAGLFLDTRTDLHELKRKHPELASKFELLGEQLNSDPDLDKTPFEAHTNVHIGQSTTSHMNRRIILQHDFDELVATIRGQPGLSDFLLPASTTEMMKAASHGPIAVINVSIHRCDAIIIERQQIGSIPLPHMHYVQVNDLAQKLRDLPFESHSSKFLLPLLEWLWAVAAHPILEYLGISHPPKDDNWPHIWWIPTGALTHLPIHAAGIHGKKSHETVMDRVISSYASSVKSLIHSRQGTIQNDAPEIQHALLVSMLNTPNQGPLPFAVDEIKAIKPLIHAIGLTPAHCKEQESTNEMLELMKSSKILHFAGHGMSHASNPSKSCLLTIDWEFNPLTVERLRQESLQDASPFLAYLSSCSTGAVRIHNMADESIHLINSCQLAGFRHVIGALWEVSDPHCVKVAKVVYEVLKEEGLNDETVAKGLHRATRNIRDSCLDVTLRECSFSKEDYNDEIKKSLKEQLENLERDFEAFGIFNKESSVVKQRDAVLIETPPHREKQTDSFLWVPYIHYGA